MLKPAKQKELMSDRLFDLLFMLHKFKVIDYNPIIMHFSFNSYIYKHFNNQQTEEK